MTIAEQLQPKLSEWTPAGDGRADLTLKFDNDRWVVSLSADKVDTLGCLLSEVIVASTAETVMSNADLRSRAESAAKRVTGLMEPLRFLELDEQRGEAMLRSESPTRRSTALAYYEVLMTTHGRIDLRRYQRADDASARQQVPFALTHEAIAKVINDLVG